MLQVQVLPQYQMCQVNFNLRDIHTLSSLSFLNTFDNEAAVQLGSLI